MRLSVLFLVLFDAGAQERKDEPFSFIVLADWHGAESFATKGVSANGYQEHLQAIQHIKANYGGELVIFPGDTNTGKWTNKQFRDLFDPSLTPKQVVLSAGKKCYRTMKKLFREGGYDELLIAMVRLKNFRKNIFMFVHSQPF